MRAAACGLQYSHLFAGVDAPQQSNEVDSIDGPSMTPFAPRFEPDRSPSPEVTRPSVSFTFHDPPGSDIVAKLYGSQSQKTQLNSGDEFLLRSLDGGRNLEIPSFAALSALRGSGDEDLDAEEEAMRRRSVSNGALIRQRDQRTAPGKLVNMAVDALKVVKDEKDATGSPITFVPDIAKETLRLSINDTRSDTSTGQSGANDTHSLSVAGDSGMAKRSTTGVPAPERGELPPIQNRELSEAPTGQSLPSILSTLGHIPSSAEAAKDHAFRHNLSTSFGSPLARLHTISHGSPPTSPDSFRQGLSSTRSPSTPTRYDASVHGLARHVGVDYRSFICKDGSPHARLIQPPTSASVADRMSIDELTNPVTGNFVCSFSGCTAAPFQTQYLLNSHANVHSSVRPHYCPVLGCSRGEGGRGFKRKNEMIRHGLVHESPGYVCPFCPDRDHKYPRPDNLQRHVRVHHPDKDKDDLKLREVLAQRADGPNRGRRRRAGPP